MRLTCGTPGDSDKTFLDFEGRSHYMGCFCFIPVKAKLSDATCWLKDHTGTGYWA